MPRGTGEAPQDRAKLQGNKATASAKLARKGAVVGAFMGGMWVGGWCGWVTWVYSVGV